MADIIDYRFRIRRRTAANWTSLNEVLLGSELGHETDTGKLKLGDGTTAWNSLAYFAPASAILRPSGTGYTLGVSDDGSTIISGSSTAFTLTIPTNASVPIPIGSKVAYTQGNAGSLIVVGASGVTVHAPNGAVTGQPYDGGVVEKIGTDEWQLWSGPALATVATTGDYNDLTAKPSLGGITAMNEQAGTTYTLILTDALKAVRATNSSAITLTLPTNSSVAFPLYTTIPVFQGGAGLVTVVGASGVTLESPNGAVTTGVGDFRVLFQRSADVWVIA